MGRRSRFRLCRLAVLENLERGSGWQLQHRHTQLAGQLDAGQMVTPDQFGVTLRKGRAQGKSDQQDQDYGWQTTVGGR
jgi:hypothetical protein